MAPSNTTKRSPRAAKPAPQTPAEPAPERLAALKDEANRGEEMAPADLLKVVQWRGVDLRVPASIDDWPIEVQEFAEDGMAVKHLRGLLGVAQWNKLKTDGHVTKMGDLGDLSETIMRDAYGQTMGE
ncbi:hypothetical protein ACFW4K_26845 [Nocardiopsis alba]|uniref:hypothetical protein n=1 Tax=Nocardiopsis alba TaxID=53437 RepID=UPI00366C6ACB